MTAEVEEKVGQSEGNDAFIWPEQILEMIDFLSCNDKIIFKSLQIDDPELESTEKVAVAKEIFLKNRQTFLRRFGSHLQERHLIAFGQLILGENVNPPLRTDENCEEMQLMLQEHQRKLHTRTRDVKNRRYAAMQDLIAKGEYFSEHEMMLRAPELYQELIGQYLSEMEKKQRDSYDVKNTTFSGILMHSMEQKELSDILNAADMENAGNDRAARRAENQNVCSPKGSTYEKYEEEVESDEDSDITHTSNAAVPIGEEDIEIPISCRQQWGNFDNEQIPCSQSKHTKSKKQPTPSTATKCSSALRPSNKLITAGERNLLRNEFIAIMQSEFLAGNDADFDYTLVDDNTQFDDLRQLDQDKEDEYFKDDDEEEAIEEEECKQEDDESEDELEIYMNHLNKHHSLQK